MAGRSSQYNRGMSDSSSINVLLATLNATELESLGRAELAEAASSAIAALRRGDVTEFKRGRAFLQSKIGHLR